MAINTMTDDLGGTCAGLVVGWVGAEDIGGPSPWCPESGVEDRGRGCCAVEAMAEEGWLLWCEACVTRAWGVRVGEVVIVGGAWYDVRERSEGAGGAALSLREVFGSRVRYVMEGEAWRPNARACDLCGGQFAPVNPDHVTCEGCGSRLLGD